MTICAIGPEDYPCVAANMNLGRNADGLDYFEDRLRIGLVQEVTPAGRQVERAMEIARLIAANAPLGVQVTKEAGRKFIEAGERAAIDVVPAIRERVMGTADAAEGIRSFVERRAAVFQVL